jgi:hypothetical protein
VYYQYVILRRVRGSVDGLRQYVTRRKVAGSSPDKFIAFFKLPNTSDHTRPLTETSSRSRKMFLGSRGRPVRARCHLRADCLDNVGSSTSHKLVIGKGIFYFIS